MCLLCSLPLSLSLLLLSTPARLVWLSMCPASASEALVMLDDDGDCGAVSSLTDHDRTQIPQPAAVGAAEAAGAAAPAETQTRTHDTPTTASPRGAEGDAGGWEGPSWVFLARCALVACVNFSLKFK